MSIAHLKIAISLLSIAMEEH